MDKTLKEKLNIVEIADEVVSGNSDIREDDYSMEDVIESASEAVDVFGEREILENVSDFTIADYALEHKQVLKLIFARIVKEDRIK